MGMPVLAGLSAMLLKKGVKTLGTIIARGGPTAKTIAKEVGNVIGEDADHPNIIKAIEKPENIELLLAYQTDRDSQITERHKTDMGSDSFLSKNIRPLTLVAVTIFLAFGSIAWGTWAMSDHKFDKIVELNLYIYLFYFGVRSMFDKNKGGLGTALKGLIGK